MCAHAAHGRCLDVHLAVRGCADPYINQTLRQCVHMAGHPAAHLFVEVFVVRVVERAAEVVHEGDEVAAAHGLVAAAGQHPEPAAARAPAQGGAGRALDRLHSKMHPRAVTSVLCRGEGDMRERRCSDACSAQLREAVVGVECAGGRGFAAEGRGALVPSQRQRHMHACTTQLVWGRGWVASRPRHQVHHAHPSSMDDPWMIHEVLSLSRAYTLGCTDAASTHLNVIRSEQI